MVILQWLKGEVLFEMEKFPEAEEAFRRGLENLEESEPEAGGESEDVEPQLRRRASGEIRARG